MRNYLFLSICLLFTVSSTIGQSFKEKDYSILQKAITEYAFSSDDKEKKDSADFIVQMKLREKDFRHYYNCFLNILDSLNLDKKFGKISKKKSLKHFTSWKWDKNKISYTHCVNSIEDSIGDNNYIAISPPFYSNNKNYFFIYIDYPTHSSIVLGKTDKQTVVFLLGKCIAIKTPAFR